MDNIDNQLKMLRVARALNDLYTYGKATVLKDEILQMVESALSSMGINYIINPDNDTYCEIELI